MKETKKKEYKMQKKLNSIVKSFSRDLGNGLVIDKEFAIKLVNVINQIYKNDFINCLPIEIKAYIMQFMIMQYIEDANHCNKDYWYILFVHRLQLMAFCGKKDYIECQKILCKNEIHNIHTLCRRSKRHYAKFLDIVDKISSVPVPANKFNIAFFIMHDDMDEQNYFTRYKKLGYLIGFADCMRPSNHLKIRLMHIIRKTCEFNVKLHICKMAKDCETHSELRHKISPFENYDVIDLVCENKVTPIWFISCDTLVEFKIPKK
tara:strand:+ start:4710 stop:5495 length:786 start_codon:yes stop_codon:yes gene_type:complete